MKHWTLAMAVALAAAWAGPLRADEVKVRIEGEREDAAKLLERLNENGKEKGLTFTNADADYRFRIAVYAEGVKAVDLFAGGGADASAAVLTPGCDLLFIVTRGGRGTKGGAMNALSKEIVKKLPQHMAAR